MTLDEVRKYQIAQLELVKMIDKLCSQLNLTYYIIGGTLLGAVRHGGFIPWDPDIDIAMPRGDYEKIKKYFSENNNDRYFYQHYSTEKNHLSPHALIKIKDSHIILNSGVSRFQPVHDGIYLDIFPLDNAPESKKLQIKQMKRIKGLKTLINLKAAYVYSSNGFVKRLLKNTISFLLTPVSFSYLNKKMDYCMRQYNSFTAENYVSMASHYSYWKQLMPKSVYGSPIRINFEGILLAAPEQMHDYLTRIYGNYMELPPVDQRTAILSCYNRVEYSSRDGDVR